MLHRDSLGSRQQIEPGAALELPPLAPEMAVYAVDGALQIDGDTVPAHTLAVLEPGRAVRLHSTGAAVRLAVIGGDVLDAPRHIWWNFVSSRKERIVQAADDWEQQRLGQVPGDTEWIPLPERRFKV